MTDPRTEVSDPTTSAQRLYELAAAHPELGAAIGSHPNSYPALREWIAANTAAPAAPSAPVMRSASRPVAADPYAAVARPAADPFAAPAASAPADAQWGQTLPQAGGWPAQQQPGQQPFPQQQYAQQQPFAAQPFGAPQRAARPSRKRLFAGVGIAVVAALVLGGGGAWWYFGSRLGGAATPEAAAGKLISSLSSMDPVGMAGSLAPSEVAELQTSITRIADAKPEKQDDDESVDVQKQLEELKKSITITPTDMEWDVEELADGVQRVTWSDGEIEVDGDERALAEVEAAFVKPYLTTMYDSWGLSKSQARDAIDDVEDSLRDSIDLPWTLDSKDMEDGLRGVPFAFVTVREGSGWYISPLLTATDLTVRAIDEQRDENGEKALRLGDEVVAPDRFDTPEAAAEALTKAVADGDADAAAAALPLPERRWLSIYGPWGQDLAEESSSGSRRGALGGLELEKSEFSAKVDGDRAHVRIEELTFSNLHHDDDVDQDVGDRVTIEDGTCASWSHSYAYDDGDYDWYSDEYQEDWRVSESSGDGCLEDVPVLKRLGAADLTLTAVKEGGGWFISPIATLGDGVGILTEHFLEYYDEGRLDELVEG